MLTCMELDASGIPKPIVRDKPAIFDENELA